MLTIRREQENVLAEDRERRFRVQLAAHLVECFPERCRELGEAQLDEEIRRGIGRARAHGFVGERDLCKYMNLVFTFGRDFDRDAALSWASELLELGCLPSQKMDRLYQKAIAEARTS